MLLHREACLQQRSKLENKRLRSSQVCVCVGVCACENVNISQNTHVTRNLWLSLDIVKS